MGAVRLIDATWLWRNAVQTISHALSGDEQRHAFAIIQPLIEREKTVRCDDCDKKEYSCTIREAAIRGYGASPESFGCSLFERKA